MSKVYPEIVPIPSLKLSPDLIIPVSPPSPRREGKILLKRQQTSLFDIPRRILNIKTDVIQKDKWFYANMILTFLSIIIAMYISLQYPPCKDNEVPLWLTWTTRALYGISALFWVRTQYSIYRHYHPVKPKFITINP